MKKLKKLIAAIASGLLMVMPIISSPLLVNAASRNITTKVSWERFDGNYDYVGSVDLPVVINTTSEEEMEDFDEYGEYCDLDDFDDEELAEWEEDYYLEPGDAKGSFYLYGYVELEYECFEEGDTITYTLPFAVGEVLYFYIHDCFELVSISGNKVTVKCVDYCDWPYIEIIAKKGSASSEEDMFWFKPMKTQLNIAAEIASQTGKETVAEASGNFALSYEIMKWLEDHPNVTLKYTLTYKDKEYNIVIKGGQKLAFPDIPWYGPEYLIGKFLQ